MSHVQQIVSAHDWLVAVQVIVTMMALTHKLTVA